MEWKPVCDRPEIEKQPGRQFIRLEGSSEHSGVRWARVYCGIAYTRPLGAEDEMLQYRKSDILQMCKEGDMDEWSAVVTHWMPAKFPPIEPSKPSTVRAALKYGRDCVMESFEHVRDIDDQVMADARLQAIDAALNETNSADA